MKSKLECSNPFKNSTSIYQNKISFAANKSNFNKRNWKGIQFFINVKYDISNELNFHLIYFKS